MACRTPGWDADWVGSCGDPGGISEGRALWTVWPRSCWLESLCRQRGRSGFLFGEKADCSSLSASYLVPRPVVFLSPRSTSWRERWFTCSRSYSSKSVAFRPCRSKSTLPCPLPMLPSCPPSLSVSPFPPFFKCGSNHSIPVLFHGHLLKGQVLKEKRRVVSDHRVLIVPWFQKPLSSVSFSWVLRASRRNKYCGAFLFTCLIPSSGTSRISEAHKPERFFLPMTLKLNSDFVCHALWKEQGSLHHRVLYRWLKEFPEQLRSNVIFTFRG